MEYSQVCLQHSFVFTYSTLLDGTKGSSEANDAASTFFSETTNGRYVPRAIFADLEPSVIGKLLRMHH
jgi:tubulin alpha